MNISFEQIADDVAGTARALRDVEALARFGDDVDVEHAGRPADRMVARVRRNHVNRTLYLVFSPRMSPQLFVRDVEEANPPSWGRLRQWADYLPPQEIVEEVRSR
jgi:hypothetical protein